MLGFLSLVLSSLVLAAGVVLGDLVLGVCVGVASVLAVDWCLHRNKGRPWAGAEAVLPHTLAALPLLLGLLPMTMCALEAPGRLFVATAMRDDESNGAAVAVVGCAVLLELVSRTMLRAGEMALVRRYAFAVVSGMALAALGVDALCLQRGRGPVEWSLLALSGTLLSFWHLVNSRRKGWFVRLALGDELRQGRLDAAGYVELDPSPGVCLAVNAAGLGEGPVIVTELTKLGAEGYRRHAAEFLARVVPGELEVLRERAAYDAEGLAGRALLALVATHLPQLAALWGTSPTP